ncbi:MAG TPA: hypothetical protein VH308_01820 [Terracidiphilus sp.]|jgi:hypothetical protein|nr:hypothetical protein [Terracidiphilus sp.]
MILPMELTLKQARITVAIKLLHTIVWLFFVACILAVPVAGGLHRFKLAGILGGLVLIECLVLAANHFRCPLSDLAARFTPELAPNFDIYLPNWLARYNKHIFGPLYIAGSLFALAEWLMSAH